MFYDIILVCRLSSVVEHAHGKGGVMSSNLIDGSIFLFLIMLFIIFLVVFRTTKAEDQSENAWQKEQAYSISDVVAKDFGSARGMCDIDPDRYNESC